MAASLAEIEIEGGIDELKCPITGVNVIVREEGFDSEADHSPHLRFFVDWADVVWVADPADLPADQARYQKRMIEIFEDASAEGGQDAMIAKCLEVLPKSALVYEILNPRPVPKVGRLETRTIPGE